MDLVYIKEEMPSYECFRVITRFDSSDVGENWTDKHEFKNLDELKDFIFGVNLCEIVCNLDIYPFDDLPHAPHTEALKILLSEDKITKSQYPLFKIAFDNNYYVNGDMEIYHYHDGKKEECDIKSNHADEIKMETLARAMIKIYQELE